MTHRQSTCLAHARSWVQSPARDRVCMWGPGVRDEPARDKYQHPFLHPRPEEVLAQLCSPPATVGALQEDAQRSSPHRSQEAWAGGRGTNTLTSPLALIYCHEICSQDTGWQAGNTGTQSLLSAERGVESWVGESKTMQCRGSSRRRRTRLVWCSPSTLTALLGCDHGQVTASVRTWVFFLSCGQ